MDEKGRKLYQHRDRNKRRRGEKLFQGGKAMRNRVQNDDDPILYFVWRLCRQNVFSQKQIFFTVSKAAESFNDKYTMEND